MDVSLKPRSKQINNTYLYTQIDTHSERERRVEETEMEIEKWGNNNHVSQSLKTGSVLRQSFTDELYLL